MYGFQIEPFALVRSPYAFITSALQQTTKNGKYHPLIGLIPGQSSAPQKAFKIPNSSKSISTLNRIFGERMNYVPFKTATSHPGGGRFSSFCKRCFSSSRLINTNSSMPTNQRAT
ncbi:hypothetical protein SynA1544_02630 [Synechococcus sp. A15-44]|nr:hypothetical protein SynA1544_02630 [Synechococcus sp. A15-44]